MRPGAGACLGLTEELSMAERCLQGQDTEAQPGQPDRKTHPAAFQGQWGKRWGSLGEGAQGTGTHSREKGSGLGSWASCIPPPTPAVMGSCVPQTHMVEP